VEEEARKRAERKKVEDEQRRLAEAAAAVKRAADEKVLAARRAAEAKEKAAAEALKAQQELAAEKEQKAQEERDRKRQAALEKQAKKVDLNALHTQAQPQGGRGGRGRGRGGRGGLDGGRGGRGGNRGGFQPSVPMGAPQVRPAVMSQCRWIAPACTTCSATFLLLLVCVLRCRHCSVPFRTACLFALRNRVLHVVLLIKLHLAWLGHNPTGAANSRSTHADHPSRPCRKRLG